MMDKKRQRSRLILKCADSGQKNECCKFWAMQRN